MSKKKLSENDSRKPGPIDIHVGRRLRMRRALMGISQEDMAEAVGLTFQQVQKYELGSNRVSAARLYQFSDILKVPVDYFYQELSSGKRKNCVRHPHAESDNDQAPAVDDAQLYSKETADLLKVYYSITDEKKRWELYNIFKAMVQSVN